MDWLLSIRYNQHCRVWYPQDIQRSQQTQHHEYGIPRKTKTEMSSISGPDSELSYVLPIRLFGHIQLSGISAYRNSYAHNISIVLKSE